MSEGTLQDDKFKSLASPGSTAKVAVTWGRSGSFGDPKVSAMVSLACDQTADKIDEAGFLAYDTAKRIVDEIIKDFESGKD